MFTIIPGMPPDIRRFGFRAPRPFSHNKKVPAQQKSQLHPSGELAW
jgi:hypothetical protein